MDSNEVGSIDETNGLAGRPPSHRTRGRGQVQELKLSWQEIMDLIMDLQGMQEMQEVHDEKVKVTTYGHSGMNT